MRLFPCLSALFATLLLAACAQGAGPAPDIRPDDPETLSRARVVLESSIDREALLAGLQAEYRERRPGLIKGLIKEGWTPVQAETAIDLLEARIVPRTYDAVIDGFVSALVHTCSPMELDLATPGQGIGPCLDLRGDALRARIKAEDAARRGPFIAEAMRSWRDALEQRAPELGLSPAQVAEVSQDIEDALANRGLD